MVASMERLGGDLDTHMHMHSSGSWRVPRRLLHPLPVVEAITSHLTLHTADSLSLAQVGQALSLCALGSARTGLSRCLAIRKGGERHHRIRILTNALCNDRSRLIAPLLGEAHASAPPWLV